MAGFFCGLGFFPVIGFRRRFLLRGIYQGHHCEVTFGSGTKVEIKRKCNFQLLFLIEL